MLILKILAWIVVAVVVSTFICGFIVFVLKKRIKAGTDSSH